MAIDINALNFLLLAYKDGARFENVLTLGRLNLNVYAGTLIARLRENQIAPKEVLALEGERPDSMFAEPLFKDLGAKSVVSLDASAYQGASLIHDLNKPIPASLADSFDLVY